MTNFEHSVIDIDKHRMARTLEWGNGGRLMGWVLLHPPTTNAVGLTPEDRRCFVRAQEWGYDGFVQFFLFSLRCSDLRSFRRVADMAEENEDIGYLRLDERWDVYSDFLPACEEIVCAWGRDGLRFDSVGNLDLIDLASRDVAPLCLGKYRGQPHHLLDAGAAAERYPTNPNAALLGSSPWADVL